MTVKNSRLSIMTLAFALMAMLLMTGDAFAANTINITVALTAPADAAYSSSTNLNFTFTPTSNNSIVNASIWATWEDGTTFAVNQTNVTEVINATLNGINVSETILPAEGAYTWNVEVCDYLHECSQATANRTVTFDRTAPVVTINSPSSLTLCSWTPTGTVTDTNKYSCSFTDSLDGVIAATLSGTTCTANAALAATAGAHTINATATDLAGNTDNSTIITYTCAGEGSGGSGTANPAPLPQTTTGTQTQPQTTTGVSSPSYSLPSFDNGNIVGRITAGLDMAKARVSQIINSILNMFGMH